MKKPWLNTNQFGVEEVNSGECSYFRVNCSANQTIEIDKLYGPLCASPVRIRLEYGSNLADWVVEYQNPSTEQWEEKARWGCQESWPEDSNEER